MRTIFYLFLLCAAGARAQEPEASPLQATPEATLTGGDPVDRPVLAEVAGVLTPPVERNLRDSHRDTMDVHDLSEVTTSASVDKFGSHRARGLQDGNPVFKHEYHDSPTDYFQITLFEFNPNLDRLGQVTTFLKHWMAIDLAVETLDVQRYKLGHYRVQNRYVATYTNSQTGLSKKYTIDADFTDGRSDRSRVPRVTTVDYLHSANSNNNYLKLFQYTVEEDCRAIREARHNPMEATCKMYRTPDNFVIPHVYDVVMRYRRGNKVVMRKGRFFVRSRVLGPETSPLKPEPVDLPSTPEIIKLITDRVRQTPFFENKSLVLRQLAHKSMIDRIGVYTNQIARWEMANKDRMRNAEQTYHTNLRRALVTDRRNKHRDNLNFDRTYNVMRRAASRINAFNIRSAIRRTARRLEDRHIIRAHRAKARYYQREMALMELMERLDHMRYLADRHLDDNFDHYYSAEYFKKV